MVNARAPPQRRGAPRVACRPLPLYSPYEYIPKEYFTRIAMTRSPDPRDFLPLTDVVFQIMLVLADGPAHGYAVMVEVERRTEGEAKLRPGTLYRAISRMTDAGLLEEAEERPAPELDDERRRYYRLSELGRRVAAAEARRRSEEVEWARKAGLLQPRRA